MVGSVPGGFTGCCSRGPGSGFGPVVMFCGPGALFGCVCGGGGQGVVQGWRGVMSVFHYSRTGMRYEQARATEKGGECQIGRGFEGGYFVGVYMFFCCIGCLPREGFQMLFVA